MKSIDNWENYLSSRNLSKSNIHQGRASRFMLSKHLNDVSIDDFAAVNQPDDGEVVIRNIDTERLNNESTALIETENSNSMNDMKNSTNLRGSNIQLNHTIQEIRPKKSLSKTLRNK